MKVVIPGGSGQVGTVLARAFHGDGHDVIVLSRRPDVRPWRVVAWDGATLGSWQNEIDGCDVVINLTGRSVKDLSINKIYTQAPSAYSAVRESPERAEAEGGAPVAASGRASAAPVCCKRGSSTGPWRRFDRQ